MWLKALDEIYKIYKRLHRSEFEHSDKFLHNIFASLQCCLQNAIYFCILVSKNHHVLLKHFENFNNFYEDRVQDPINLVIFTKIKST